MMNYCCISGNYCLPGGRARDPGEKPPTENSTMDCLSLIRSRIWFYFFTTIATVPAATAVTQNATKKLDESTTSPARKGSKAIPR
jgi:hypothetical protein